MASTIVQRYNEGTPPVSIGGMIEFDGATYTVTQNAWTCYTTSSSDTAEARVYWWFNTAQLPPGCTVISVRFKVRYIDAFTDTGGITLSYYLHADALGASLDSSDFNSNNIYTGPGGGYFMLAEQPVIGATADTGELTAAAALAEVSTSAYTNVIAKATASDLTSGYGTFTGPSGWRSTVDGVPRLLVTYTINKSTFTASIPAIAAIPVVTGVPSTVGTPGYIYNP